MFGDAQRIFGREVSKPTDVSTTLRRFAGYFKPYWKQYLFVIAMMAVATWSEVRAPQLFGQAVDCFITPATAGSLGDGKVKHIENPGL